MYCTNGQGAKVSLRHFASRVTFALSTTPPLRSPQGVVLKSTTPVNVLLTRGSRATSFFWGAVGEVKS